MGTRPLLFGRCFADTYIMGNRSSSLSSMHQTLTGDVNDLNVIDLHIKCKFYTYYRPWKPKNITSLAQFVCQTVPMTWPWLYGATEGDYRSDYVVTDSTCVPRRASRARIYQCWDAWILLACKSMGKILILGNFVTNAALVISASCAEAGELLRSPISEDLMKQRPKNNGQGTAWLTLTETNAYIETI